MRKKLFQTQQLSVPAGLVLALVNHMDTILDATDGVSDELPKKQKMSYPKMQDRQRLQMSAPARHNENLKHELSGLGQLEAVQEILSLVKVHGPSLVFERNTLVR